MILALLPIGCAERKGAQKTVPELEKEVQVRADTADVR